MGRRSKFSGMVMALAALGACSMTQTAKVKVPPRGERLNIKHIIAANPQKTACVDYDTATNSCAMIITSTVEGDTVISQERTALLLAGGGGTQHIETVRRSTVRDGQACTQADGVSVTGRDEMSAFVLSEARSLYDRFGGSICATYFRAGDGYVVSRTGANGAVVPPGDVNFQYIVGEAQLRAQ